mmetsp:Transcript_5295/g.16992  ORF Transcript_5295/g.16992 Transcript_5295/m.16992 type:complete len:85 (-) Transcript_5295:1036-1290(-)
MHDQGVIHRDLKLENVLLNHADDCKVCDFGLAHLFRRERGKIVRRPTKSGPTRAHLPQTFSGASNDVDARAAHGDLRLKVVRRT